MQILAVITLDANRVGGGAPIFYAQNSEELSHFALLISKILGAAVHELQEDVLIVVRH